MTAREAPRMHRAGRVGIYGGTFNPVHLGHLRAAVEVREAARLDEVWLVPANHPPHKGAEGIAPAAHRLAMLEGALAGARGLRVEPIELERDGPSYSVETVRLLKARHPDTEFALLLGSDAFREIHTWFEYRDLLASCDLIVTTRPPEYVKHGANPSLLRKMPIAVKRAFCYRREIGCYLHESGHRLQFVPVTQLEISASALRAAVARGASIRYLVPEAVLAYVHEHGLYRTAS